MISWIKIYDILNINQVRFSYPQRSSKISAKIWRSLKSCTIEPKLERISSTSIFVKVFHSNTTPLCNILRMFLSKSNDSGVCSNKIIYCRTTEDIDGQSGPDLRAEPRKMFLKIQDKIDESNGSISRKDTEKSLMSFNKVGLDFSKYQKQTPNFPKIDAESHRSRSLL